MPVGSLLRETPWAINRRVVSALVLREMITRYGRHNIGFLWVFVEPMLFTLFITALWSWTKTIHGSSIPIVAFALTGYSSLLMWRNMPGRCAGALKSNLTLLYHRQVTIMDVYVARLLLEFMAISTSFVALGIVFSAVQWMPAPENVIQVLGGWLLLAWFGMALSLTVSGLAEKSSIVTKIWPPLAYLMMPISGVAFIVDALPPSMQKIAVYVPQLNALEYLREGWFGSGMRAHYDIGYVAVFNLFLTFAGVNLIRQVHLVAADDD
jgi:ABC-type polysaccharide/polyol phosphate export permease